MIFSDMKNRSVKRSFVTKNSKHPVGTGAKNLLALIEFTPLLKTEVSNLPFVTKNQKFAYKNKTMVTYLHYLKSLRTQIK